MSYDPSYPPNISPHGENPYVSPAAQGYEKPGYSDGGRPIGPVTKLQYMYAFQYVFENPNWIMTIMAGTLAILSSSIIPIIGPLIFMGYQYEVIDHLHRRRTMPYPEFDFNRFGDYLSRGVAPLVVGLVFGLLLAFATMLLYGVGLLVGALIAAGLDSAGAPPEVAGFIIMVLVVLAVIVFFFLMAGIMLVTLPMSLRAGLSGNVGEGFNFGFVKDFIARTWKEMLLGSLWLIVASQLVAIVGLLLCCVGVYPASALNMMASTHIHWQLYEIYLSRGGMAIPLKEPK